MSGDDDWELVDFSEASAGMGPLPDVEALQDLLEQLASEGQSTLDAFRQRVEQVQRRARLIDVFIPHICDGSTAWPDIFARMPDADRTEVGRLLAGRELMEVMGPMGPGTDAQAKRGRRWAGNEQERFLLRVSRRGDHPSGCYTGG